MKMASHDVCALPGKAFGARLHIAHGRGNVTANAVGRAAEHRARVRRGEAGFDQNGVPNILLAHDPSLSTKGAGGSCGS